MTDPVSDLSALAPNGTLLSRGVQMPKSPVLAGPRVRRALRTGTYERKEADAALKMVQPGDRVLELGAGIGFMSALIASQIAVDCVESYEANPELIEYIRRVHTLNGLTNTHVVNALLAPLAGDPVPFYVRRNFLASSLDPDVRPDGIIATHHVPRHGINDVIARLKPSVLICDIEGAEADLLPAADLSGLRVAVVELHPQWIKQRGVQAVFDSFHQAGLTYWPKASEGKVVTFRRGW